ncbi:transmembrane protein 207 isoform X2 [Erythrolamprus reginae]|uniref:transmembrane protein 207 isoform X2 n=1 Tax=Erythrolamprus reginae TaxID=121349 RepID=UPI00396C60BB
MEADQGEIEPGNKEELCEAFQTSCGLRILRKLRWWWRAAKAPFVVFLVLPVVAAPAAPSGSAWLLPPVLVGAAQMSCGPELPCGLRSGGN